MENIKGVDLLTLTSDIVAAYVSNNPIPVSELPAVIKSIHSTLGNLNGTASLTELAMQISQEPPVEGKKPGKGAQMARSAGSQAQLVSREGGMALLKLPSGEIRRVLVECMATVGQVGNVDHENVSLGKAGRKRWMGKTPHNRGVSMNPVDHPHGGGEGKTSGGRHPVTPWGQPTRGFKTRNNKRTDKWIVNRKSKKR